MKPSADGRALRLLAIVDEYKRESLSIDVGRKLWGKWFLSRKSSIVSACSRKK